MPTGGGDPNGRATHDQIVNYIKNKDALTVNYVISANRITSMTPLTWMGTTTGARNPWGWKVEIDPTLTPDVYKTTAALIYIIEVNNPQLKNQPIRLHKEFMNTSCSEIDTKLLRELVNQFHTGQLDINTGQPAPTESPTPAQ